MNSELLPALRPFQKSAIDAISRGGHWAIVAPTGSGKSRIFQEALLRGISKRMLIVVPLIALARQHAERLRLLGIPYALRGEHPPDRGAWILSPESVFDASLRQVRGSVSRWRPDAMVVDECHCVVEWGESFRPEYGSLPSAARMLQAERSLWLTATLPEETYERIRALSGLKLQRLGRFAFPPELSIRIDRVPLTIRAQSIVNRVSLLAGPGIVFTVTRGQAERLARVLSVLNRRTFVYHAGLFHEERRIVEERVHSQAVEIVVATCAFGMGLDFDRFRWVLVSQPPLSFLSLVQMFGRVGRVKGRKDRAFLFWDPEDWRLLGWSNDGSTRRHLELKRLRDFCGLPDQRERVLAEYFGGRLERTLCPMQD